MYSFPPGRGLRPSSAPARARSGRLAVQLHRVRRPSASTHYAPVQTRASWGGGWRPLGHRDELLAAAALASRSCPGLPSPMGSSTGLSPGRLWVGLVTRGGQRPTPGDHRGGRALPGQTRGATGGLRVATGGLCPPPDPHGPQRPPEGRTPSSPSSLTSRGLSETYRAGWCGSFPRVGRTESRLHPPAPALPPLDGVSDQEGRPRSPRAHELRSCSPGRGRAALSAGSRREGCARGRGRGRIRGWGAGRLHWAWIGGDPARAGPAGSREPEPQLSGRDAHSYGPGVSESSRVAGLAAAAATAATVAGVGGRGVSR